MSEKGGRYEQIGYPIRAMEYLSYLLLYFQCQEYLIQDQENLFDQQMTILTEVLNGNDGISRPLFDNHSIPIALTLNFFIGRGKREEAIIYLRNALNSILLAYNTHRRLPDGNNSMETVIRFAVSKNKSVYYQDETSHLFGMMLEYMAILDMETEYDRFRAFIQEVKVDAAIFVPFDDEQLAECLPGTTPSHEL